MSEPFQSGLPVEESFGGFDSAPAPFDLGDGPSEADTLRLAAEIEGFSPDNPFALVNIEELEGEIEQMLGAYDGVMEDRWKREELIERCYNLETVTEWTGEYEGASELVSEIMLSTIDQAQARLAKSLFSAKPFVDIKGVESDQPEVNPQTGQPDPSTNEQSLDAADIAEPLEQFVDDYIRRTMKGEEILECASGTSAKFGVTAVKLDWIEEDRAKWTLIHNRDMVAWPSWVDDWDDLEWAGHRTIVTKSGLRRLEREWGGFDPAFLHEVENSVQSATEAGTEGTFGDLGNVGIDPEQVTSLEPFGIYEVYHLWGNTILPGLDEPVTFQLLYHPQSRRIGKILPNDRRSQRHPYFPLRVKRTAGTAWPKGIGDAALMMTMADTAYLNLGMDTLLSAAFGVHIMKEGSIMDQQFDRPMPGQKLSTDDPTGDYRFESLADAEPLKMLEIAQRDIQRRKVDATGQSSVLSGQGDPVMKSGAGTGSTMALIQEGQTKFEQADHVFRRDVAALVLHTLDLISQRMPEEYVYVYSPVEDSELLKQGMVNLNFVPPGGRIQDYVQISVEAPSAANNRELLRTNLMVAFEFINKYSDKVFMLAQQIFGAVNPAGLIEYLHQWTKFLDSLTERIIEAYEIPNLKGKMPRVLPQIDHPAELMVNQLLMQIQQLQEQVQLLAAAGSPGSPGGQSGAGPGGNGGPPP